METRIGTQRWTGQNRKKLSKTRLSLFLSKRLTPQLIFKGGIINAWNKRLAVALNSGFCYVADA